MQNNGPITTIIAFFLYSETVYDAMREYKLEYVLRNYAHKL